MRMLSNIVIIATLLLSFVLIFSLNLFSLSLFIGCLILMRILGFIEEIQAGLREGKRRKERLKKQKEQRIRERIEK